MNRKEQLAYMVGAIEHSESEGKRLKYAIEFARKNGIETNMHLGKSEEWFNQDRENRVAEWLMGQFLDGYEKKQYLGFNSAINLSMSFLHGTY